MRVLLTHRPGGAYGYISDGWLNALIAGGHVAMRWDGQYSSWNDFGPDLYIGCSGHRQPIPARSRDRTKIAIHVNPYCGTLIDGINEPQDAIKWTLDQSPTVVFGYGHEGDRQYWEYWTTRHSIPWVPMPTGGDSTLYRDGGQQRDIDVAYVGGYWPYKGRSIDKYLLPVLKSGLKSAVFGWGDWPIAVNQINDDAVPAVLARAKIGPCVSEPHTAKWGIDVPERLWKVALSGALVIHDRVCGLNRLLATAIVADDPCHYVELCKYYVSESNESERRKVADAQRTEVLKCGTYFQRIAKLFSVLHEATGCSGGFGDAAIKLAMLQ